jgi:hypothetical protein
VPPAEVAERARIIDESIKRNLGYGTVRVYVTGPDGHTIASIGVVLALQNDNLLTFLQKVSEQLHVKPGPPVVTPRPQSVAPKNTPQNALVIHATARGAGNGSWREFPGENWIVLTPEQWNKVLPTGDVTVGTTWQVDPGVARTLLTVFYPQTEDTESRIDRNKFDKHQINGKVISIENGVARARLDAAVQMSRMFYPGRVDSTSVINATILGFVDFATDRSHINAIEMVTSKALFGAEEFDASLRSGFEATK